MADKMMRIAGRGVDGTAKAITTDKDGILKVSDDRINEVERGSYLGSGLWEEFYSRGVENKPFSGGYSLGSGSFLKNDGYMELVIGDNPSARAERSVNSEVIIDLTDFSNLFFEYEFEGTTSYNSFIHFSVASTKNTSYPTYTKGIQISHKSTDGVVNNIEKLNVSDINKQQFIKIHLVDTSQAVSVPASLKITRIWGERTKPKDKEVSDLVDTSTQIERSSKLGSGLWEEFYYDGIEKVDLTQGYKLGSGLVSKEEDYVKLELLSNSTSVAEQSLTTTKPVDLTDFGNLYLEYEFEGKTSYNSDITFKVGSNPNTSYPTYTKRKEITHKGDVGIVRNVIKLNVADVKSYEYIFIHLTDRAQSVSVPSTLKIKAIWGERTNPINKEVRNLTNTSTQIERSSKLGSGLWEEFYYDGIEKVVLEQGYSLGSGLVSKEEDYVKLELLNNPTSVAEQSVTTTKPIDLTEFANLYLEYEFEGTPSYNSHITFKVGSTQNTSYPTYTKRKEITHQGNVGVVRNVIKLNVSDVKSYEYIFIHLSDRSQSISVPATLKIKAIWGERLKPKSLSVGGSVTSTIQGKDYETGEALEITAVKDNNGKGALYVVDAAPYGYSSETQSIRTSEMTLYKIPTLSKTQVIQGNTSLETDVLFVDNIRQLFINIHSGYASSPFGIEINYYLSNGTSKLESKLLKDVTADMNALGTSIKHEVESAFISLTIKNNSSNSRTFTLETFGG